MTYSDLTQTYEDIKIKADTIGVAVVPADGHTLQIDIDNELDWEEWKANSELLVAEYGKGDPPPALHVKDIKIEISKSGLPHRHITVLLSEEADVWKRIALQAILGSHMTREALNAYRVLTGSDCPIVFFEKNDRTPYSEKFEGRHIILE